MSKQSVNEPNNHEIVTISDDMLVEEKINFEHRMSYFPLISLTLILVNVIIFGWEISTDALSSKSSIIESGALYRENVLAGELWRLVTAMFLHGGLDHLIGNCLVLYILGIACEHAFGRSQMLAIYFIAGLSGAVLSVAVQPGPSVGASGAIFGVIGSVITFFYQYRNQLVRRDNRVGWVLLLWALYQIVTGFMTPYIDNFAHLGGFVGGVLVAWLIKSPLIPQNK
jgi:rhomboid protease GluP